MNFHWLSLDEMNLAGPFKDVDGRNEICIGKDGKYYFWDELRCDISGPYETLKEAESAINEYAKTL
jgi:hypothetical protein